MHSSSLGWYLLKRGFGCTQVVWFGFCRRTSYRSVAMFVLCVADTILEFASFIQIDSRYFFRSVQRSIRRIGLVRFVCRDQPRKKVTRSDFAYSKTRIMSNFSYCQALLISVSTPLNIIVRWILMHLQ